MAELSSVPIEEIFLKKLLRPHSDSPRSQGLLGFGGWEGRGPRNEVGPEVDRSTTLRSLK